MDYADPDATITEDDIEAILNKYKIDQNTSNLKLVATEECSNVNSHITQNKSIVISDSDSDTDCIDIISKPNEIDSDIKTSVTRSISELEILMRKYSDSKIKDNTEPLIPKSSNLLDTKDTYIESVDLDLQKPFSTYQSIQSDQIEDLHVGVTDEKTSTISKTKRSFQLDKETELQEKIVKKAEKQEEILRSKKIKQAIKEANKNISPEECLKFITVLINSKILEENYGFKITEALETSNISYKAESQLVPYTIKFNYQSIDYLIDDYDELTKKVVFKDADEILIIIHWDKVVDLVHNKTLNQYLQSIKTSSDQNIILILYGLESYFSYKKKLENRTMQSEIRGTALPNRKLDKLYQQSPNISRNDLEMALTEVQIIYSFSHRMIDCPKDVGLTVLQFAKAIARIPYKLEKSQKHEENNWYLDGFNKNCVKIDKNGNGLQRLWQQQLTTFPMASLDHAEAIIAIYPTLLSLLEKYDICTQEQGETLLQDIPIRRAAGYATTSRKIGLELSKKIYKFLTSVDGDLLL